MDALDDSIHLSPWGLAQIMDAVRCVTERRVRARLIRFQTEKNRVLDSVYLGADPDVVEHELCSVVNGLLDDLVPGWRTSVMPVEERAEEASPASGPFDGELSVYRRGRFVMGVNAPFVGAALEALHKAIGDAMFSEPVESSPPADAVDPHVASTGKPSTRD